jgi:hypothetical protein
MIDELERIGKESVMTNRDTVPSFVGAGGGGGWEKPQNTTASIVVVPVKFQTSPSWK